MGCTHPKEIIESFNEDLKEIESMDSKPYLENKENIIELKKGGLVIQTKIGNIQFGIPPETVKDSLSAGLTVPSHYIIPNNRFDRDHILSAAEFEFPAYFNFFVLKKTINLIVDDEAERAIRTIFQETLLGPKDLSTFKDEFTFEYPCMPDLRAELVHFAKNPFTGGELKFESLINIINYDKVTNIAIIGDGVCVERKDGWISIHEDDNEIARFRDKVVINAKMYETYNTFFKEHDEAVENLFHTKIYESNDDSQNNVKENGSKQHWEEIQNDDQDKSKINNFKSKTITPFNEENETGPNTKSNVVTASQNKDLNEELGLDKIKVISEIPVGFNPPDLGITFLGTGHGFDVKDATSGHIIWVNGKGIMIDPPPFSSHALKYYGVSPNLIDKIIITHCHADHDAGVMQKLQVGNKIEQITTPTIMGSFIRKYTSVCKMDPTELQSLFEYRPITIGHDLEINGGKFNFFYSLHVIPCIGYECTFKGKTVFFSGDTYYDPEALEKMKDKGVQTPSRYEMLAKRKWESYDLILHEAGVPPIHTPTKVLQTLSDEAKAKMRLYHIATKDMPVDSGLIKATPGFENTIVLLEQSDGNVFDKNLDLISNIAMFRDMPLRRLSDLQNCLKSVSYKKNETICKKGTIGWDFFIVKSGIIRIYNDDDKIAQIKFEKYLYAGDYFGEAAITGDGLRLANVKAHTDCQLLTLTTYDFKWFFGPMGNNVIDVNTIVMDKMTNLNELRKGLYGEFINTNKFINKMTEQQKMEINSCQKEVKVSSNEVLWRKEDGNCKYCFFIYSGEFALFGHDKAPGFSLRRGQFVGDFPNQIQNKVCVSTLKCIKNGLIQKLDKKSFSDFVQKNPGQHVVLKDKLVIDQVGGGTIFKVAEIKDVLFV